MKTHIGDSTAKQKKKKGKGKGKKRVTFPEPRLSITLGGASVGVACAARSGHGAADPGPDIGREAPQTRPRRKWAEANGSLNAEGRRRKRWRGRVLDRRERREAIADRPM